MATANGFLNFLGGYSIFQGPVVGIMIVDYFLIRKGNMELLDMYTKSSTGRYYYWNGINVRAYIAFVVGFVLPLPGFVASFGYTIGAAASKMYALGWILSFIMGSLSYWVVCRIWKVPGDDSSGSFENKVPIDLSAFMDEVWESENVGETETPEMSDKEAKVKSSMV